MTPHGYHQMDNTEIRLIIFFAAKDGEVYIVSKIKNRGWLIYSGHEVPIMAKSRNVPQSFCCF